MFCDVCHKNSATVHLTEVINDKVMEMHLCQACAKLKAEDLKKQLSIADLVGGLVDIQGIASKELSVKCPFCGLTYSGFKKKGRLGCGQCYSTFKDKLLPILRKIHSSSHHTGKIPSSLGRKASGNAKLKELQKKLEQAIKLEEYEEAARLRDKIKELEKKKDV